MDRQALRRQDELAAIERHIRWHGVTKPPELEPAPPGWVDAWTDGACFTLSRRGGWGAILICEGKEREISGGAHDTTNNRMELMGAISALEALTRPSQVRLFSDSQYVIKGASRWLKAWKRRQWTKRDGAPVVNIDLWMRLDIAMRPHRIDWRWVKGHAGTALNERADRLAAEGAAKR